MICRALRSPSMKQFDMQQAVSLKAQEASSIQPGNIIQFAILTGYSQKYKLIYLEYFQGFRPFPSYKTGAPIAWIRHRTPVA